MHFTKMHGAGNDFVILENLHHELDGADLSALALKLCTRRTGIGADGMMVVTPAEDADYGMLFYNADGTAGEMCGNGARCIARYGFEHGLCGNPARIRTTAGIVLGWRIDGENYRVRLNDPTVTDLHRIAPANGQEYDCVYMELGCPGIPHAVVILPESVKYSDRDALRETGRALRFSPAFPKGANVDFVFPAGQDAVDAVTFERGVEDFTLACGTGCGSIACALSMLGRLPGNALTINMPGGKLSVTLTPTENGPRDIYLTGPTCVVCTGETLI